MVHSAHLASKLELTNKKAVLFDVGGTLIEPRPSVGDMYASIGKRYGLRARGAELERVFDEKFMRREREAALIAPDTERQWWRTLVASVVEPFGGVTDFDAYFDELYAYFARPEAWYVFPDALALLDALRARRIAMGVVSNWDSRLIPLCEQLGLAAYMRTMAVSAHEGCAKPDKALFLRALERLGAAPAEAMHVGDSIEMDWQGARNAGIEAVIVDRQGKISDSRVTTVRSLCSLLSANTK